MTRDEIIEKNQRLVHKVVRKYYMGKGEYEELVSVGNFGLIKAAEKYDPSRGAKFSTCAVLHIRSEITHYFRGLDSSKRKVNHNTLSIHSPMYEDTAFCDMLKDEDENVENRVMFEIMLSDMGKHLNPRELKIMEETIDGKAQQTIAKELGFSQGEISRCLANARRKLRSAYL